MLSLKTVGSVEAPTIVTSSNGGHSPEQVAELCVNKLINVGDNAHPLYQWIANDYGKTPKWNFYKYLFDGQGNLVESWSSMTKPDSEKITSKIDQLI